MKPLCQFLPRTVTVGTICTVQGRTQAWERKEKKNTEETTTGNIRNIITDITVIQDFPGNVLFKIVEKSFGVSVSIRFPNRPSSEYLPLRTRSTQCLKLI